MSSDLKVSIRVWPPNKALKLTRSAMALASAALAA
jgi:hypothetical protein